VKAHVQVTSKSADGEVGKLSYQAKGPFQISEILGHNAYNVKRYNDPNSATQKYKGTELYLLLFEKFTCPYSISAKEVTTHRNV
jgi:hypothetical protein